MTLSFHALEYLQKGQRAKQSTFVFVGASYLWDRMKKGDIRCRNSTAEKTSASCVAKEVEPCEC